jgi:hypothetical protein
MDERFQTEDIPKIQSPEESIRWYKGSGYGIINSFLRNNIVDEPFLQLHKHHPLLKHIVFMDAVMQPLNRLTFPKEAQINDQELVVYRGIPNLRIPQTWESTKELTDLAYGSTSFTLNGAKPFVSPDNGCCLLRIHIPKALWGQVGGFIFNEKAQRGKRKEILQEDEILLQRNLLYRFDSSPPVNNVYNATLEPYAILERKMKDTERKQLETDFRQQVLDEHKLRIRNLDEWRNVWNANEDRSTKMRLNIVNLYREANPLQDENDLNFAIMIDGGFDEFDNN